MRRSKTKKDSGTDLSRALRENEERFEFLMDLASEWYWEQDENLRFTAFIGKGLDGARIDTEEFLGTYRWDHGTPLGDGGLWDAHKRVVAAHQPFDDFIYQFRTSDGVIHYSATSGRPIVDKNGKFKGYRGIARDVTARITTDLKLHESADRFRDLTELSAHWFWEQDAQFRFTLVSPTITAKTGMPPETYIGKTRWDPSLGIHLSQAEWKAHRETLEAHQPFHDFCHQRVMRDGSTIYVSVSGKPIFDESGKFIGYRGIGHDVTDRKMAEERIRYLASHDGLTSLPNRTMFNEMLNYAIQSAHRYNRSFAVLFIDLDRFKVINDTFGHEAGDTLLQEIGKRLTQTVRTSDIVARLGGDEFVVLVQEVNESQQAATVARKILSSVIRPVVLLGQECRVTASIGICLYPLDARDEQTLMKNADIAMYRAKEEGKNNFQFYSEQINTHSLERLALESNLRRALERKEFLLHYQAKLDLKSDMITGVEALLRWQHPDLGLVSPAQFIPLAEETGLIVQIGKWVLRTACAQNVQWQRQGVPPICISVNLSARQFADETLIDDISNALRETGMDSHLLELEITESMVMQNAERSSRVLAAIKAMGVRIALDDFGTGYSSLAQIKRFPIDTLKVDRSFIREIPQNPEDKAITQAIIAMGKTLSLTVVAEGVETQEQQTFLRDHACDEMQGFYFSKPIPADQFLNLVLHHDRRTVDNKDK